MKLKTKIQLSFCVPVVALLLLIGTIIIVKADNASTKIVKDSMSASATLAANHISEQFGDYLGIVEMLGNIEKLNSGLTREEKFGFLDLYAKKFGFASFNALGPDGKSLLDGTDFSSRDYFKTALAGTPNVSDITLSPLTGKYGVSVAAPFYNVEGDIFGVLYFRLDSDFILSILDSISISDNSYAYLIDKEGNIIAHKNSDLILNYNMKEQKGSIKTIAEDILKGEAGDGSYKYEGKELLCGYSPIGNTNGWSIVIAAPKSDFTSAINKIRNIVFIAVVVAILIVLVISFFLARSISKPIIKVKNALTSVAEGNLNVTIDKNEKKDEISVLQNATSTLLDTLSEIMGQANAVLSSIAKYDLTAHDMSNFPGDFNNLSSSVNSIKSTLTDLIVEVQNAVYSVDTGSRELAQATAALSQGTVTQANSIQTLADDLNVIVDRIKSNSVKEEEINNNLGDLDNQIQNANHEMEELLKVVGDIKVMSSSILKIVETIDSIAFQTNILSLNASVEAARAGEMGSGFAVVAEEIRALAEKCSDSSKKTSDLINQCIRNIDNAKTCADTTFDSLSGVVDNSAKIAVAFQAISADTTEQAEKSVRIQNEVNAISDVVQTNTATVEETAASTAVLSDQAMHLDEMIRNFITE